MQKKKKRNKKFEPKVDEEEEKEERALERVWIRHRRAITNIERWYFEAEEVRGWFLLILRFYLDLWDRKKKYYTCVWNLLCVDFCVLFFFVFSPLKSEDLVAIFFFGFHPPFQSYIGLMNFPKLCNEKYYTYHRQFFKIQPLSRIVSLSCTIRWWIVSRILSTKYSRKITLIGLEFWF